MNANYRSRRPPFRRRRVGKPWQINNINGNLTGVDGTQTLTPIFVNSGQGLVTIKNITIDMNMTASTADKHVVWALVYVPHATTAGTLDLTTGDEVYEPQQNVIAVGVVRAPFEEVDHQRLFTPMARKLFEGDQIAFLTRGTGIGSHLANCVIRFALKT